MLRPQLFCLFSVLAVVAIPGCASADARTSTVTSDKLERLIIKGALSYRARIALPPKAFAVVELREDSTPAGVVIAEYHKELGGQQVPLPFEFAISRTSFKSGRSYNLRGVVLVEGRPAWVSGFVAINDSKTTLWNKGDRTTITVRGRTLPECGDELRAKLQGEEWVVESLDGSGSIDDSRLTLAFGSDGRVTGNASCNTYMGGYLLTAGGIILSEIATTLKACPPPLMAQEDKFIDMLKNVARFEINADGALILHTGDGRTIRARR